MLITIGGVEQFDSDTWEVDPYATWIEDPTGTWIEECNFQNTLQLVGESDGPEIELAVRGRSTASFMIWDEDAATHFEEGEVVEIRDDDYTLLFGGVVATIEEERPLGPTTHRVHHISCVDWTYLADKRLVFLAVENMAAGDIVTLIHSTILADEGVTIGHIDSGVTVDQFSAGYCTVTEALEALAEYCDYIQFIDENRALYFVPSDTYPSDHVFDEDNMIEESYSYAKGNDNYRNRQYVIGGSGQTALITEEFPGDTKTKTFKTSRPIAVEPTIYVNDVAKTVGVAEVDASGTHDWYWNEGSDAIIQDDAADPMGSSDTLKVEYYGLYDIITASTDYAEVARRAALDGSSGIVEEVVTGSMLTTLAAAVDAAEAKLTRYARTAEKFEFQCTDGEDLAVGQTLTITFDGFDLDEVEYLITGITIKEHEDCKLYTVTCCDGPADSTWEDVYIDMNISARSGKIELGTLNLADLLVYKGFTKTWAELDYPNPFNPAILDGDVLLPGEDLLPGFDEDDRWLYMAVYQGGAEVFRKPVLSVEHLSDRDLITCYIANSEAVGAISHIGLWGGEQCSATAGSGIELDKQAYVRTKTSLEALQVSFTEIKGW